MAASWAAPTTARPTPARAATLPAAYEPDPPAEQAAALAPPTALGLRRRPRLPLPRRRHNRWPPGSG
eukprot:9002229-Lingulodinium_polyedra.AAC.1